MAVEAPSVSKMTSGLLLRRSRRLKTLTFHNLFPRLPIDQTVEIYRQQFAYLFSITIAGNSHSAPAVFNP
jgi:hypothetical protein